MPDRPAGAVAAAACLHMRQGQWGFCTECGADIFDQDAATQARSRHFVPEWLITGLAPSKDVEPRVDAAEGDCPHDMEAVGVTPRHGTQYQCRRCGDLAP